MQLINDKRQHSLSPEARLVERNRRTDVMRRAHKLFCQSGISIHLMRELVKSRSGRRRLSSLVYRATKEHYVAAGRVPSYAIARARNARMRFHRTLRKEAEYIIQRGQYSDHLRAIPEKDTSNPMEACYCAPEPHRPIAAISPLANLVSGLAHNRKPQRTQAASRKPIATTEKGNVFAGDSEASQVKRILNK